MVIRTPYTTRNEQAFFVAGKGQFVVMQEAFYEDSYENQADPVQVEAVIENNTVDATRINCLNTVMTLVKALPEMHDKFVYIYSVDTVVTENALGQARNWLLHYRQHIDALIDKLGDDFTPEKIEDLAFPYMKNGQKFDRVVTLYEVQLWEELFVELGRRPYITLRSLSEAKTLKDSSHSRLNEKLVADLWDAIRDLGADIKEPEKKEEKAPSKRIAVSLGIASKKPLEDEKVAGE